jgi:16S rRNA (adenine1518-N6/adenine1519-N6)-dimethyltransferase
MKQVIGPDRQKVNNLLEEAGIDPARRAETLSLDEFARIADCVRESI